MKVVRLEVENFLKLRAVSIDPKGHVVQITGRNAQGKSSILNAVWAAVEWSANAAQQPIRKGETKARIRVDLGEIIVERRFTDKGTSLIVENAQGARFPSPQKLLDDLVGHLAFDPLAFSRMKPRDQFDELRRISEIDVNIDELDGLNRSDFAKRTDVNRDAKAKRAQADAIVVAPGLPAEPLDENALLNQLQEAGVTNTQIEHRKARRQEAAQDVATARRTAQADRDRAAELRKQAEALDAQAAQQEAHADALQKKIDDAEALPDPVDVEALRAKLDAAKETNRQIAARERRAQAIREAEQLEARSRELTDQMSAREKAKADAIARAKMPVPGLGFGEGIVTYNGVPLAQASSAEQLRVSVSIAMSANPKLRVIRIQDGSLLDEENLAAIAELAKAGDYQLWVESVRTDGKVGIVIEDGAIVAVDGEAVAPAAADAAAAAA